MTKTNIYVDVFVLPGSRNSAYGRKNIIISNKTFQVPIFEKKIHITESYLIKFLVNIWNHGKNVN